MSTVFVGLRTTRSKRVFSPYGLPPDPILVSANFSKLLKESTSAELDRNLRTDQDSQLDEDASEEEDDIEAIPSVDAPDAIPPQHRSKRPLPLNAPGSNTHRHKKRRRKRDQPDLPFGHSLDDALKTKAFSRAEAIQTEADVAAFPAAKNAYTARRETHKSGARKLHSPQDLDELGLQRIEYKPGVIRPILDSDGRLGGCFVDKPRNDPTWDADALDAHEAMRAELEAAGLKPQPHRRGTHVAINTGSLVGGGSVEPSYLKLGGCLGLIRRLIGRESVIRIAHYQSASFEPWAPRLYEHFRESVTAMHEQMPHLQPNFKKSVFPMICFNFARRGKNVICFRHRDIMNVPYGWCAITPLGQFDHRKGGHVILWDYGIYLEVPAGTTLYIPSASVEHSNTALSDPANEERSSMTQYFPGGILRWLDNGFMSDKQLKAEDPARFDDVSAWKLGRWERGLHMLSTWDELVSEIDA